MFQRIARYSYAFLLVCGVGAGTTAATDTTDASLNEQRRSYTEARQALKDGNIARYERLRTGLNDYPLAIYLDYARIARHPGGVSPQQAREFITRSADSPLALRFLGAYLRAAGKSGRWRDFLQLMPEEPNSIDLKCYFFRAQLARGDKDLAWEGAARLWVAGNSQPGACDALFQAWQDAGGLTDDLVWLRLRNAFDAGEGSLLRYVARKSSSRIRPAVDTLLAVYVNPASLAARSLDPEDPLSADIASHGLAALARGNPELALSSWIAWQQQLRFDEQQTRLVESAIALRSLFAETASHRDWLDGALARLQDDILTGIRLRWALREQDWDALERTLPLLTESARDDNVWRYWRAAVQSRRGEVASAQAALEQLSGERDYYGFLAADKLGRPYAFNHLQLTLSEDSAVAELPAVRRIAELKYHREEMQAHSEWYKLLQDTSDVVRQQDLALLATRNHWYRMAIDAATRAQVWDALDQRFPRPYQVVFEKNADLRQVPSTELMAIARRESAFFAGAQSPVGARGLMQVMPATGREVASSLGQRHRESDLFDVEYNVMLGSAYYRQLLDRYDGNRVFALTAYNAGPHRVARWRNKSGQGVPVEFWVETIPYKETRNYVQAVLSYNVVFQYMQGEQQQTFLTPEELAASY